MGSLTEKGYPYFSGTVVYSSCFDIEKKYNKIFLEIEDFREYIEVFINNTLVDCIIWQPAKIDISTFIVTGKNTVCLKVTNTMANFLEKRMIKTGILVSVKILQY